MKISILGAGAWGTALAIGSAPRHEVTLWARDASQAKAVDEARVNSRYLPNISLPKNLAVANSDAASAAVGADLVVVATPMSALRGVLQQFENSSVPVAWLCKGFEAASGDNSGLLGHEVWQQVVTDKSRSHGVLSGPSFAQEVARGQPTALVAASSSADMRKLMVNAFHGPTLRVYENDDIVGVEVGGAVKNVLAIATGLCDGLSLGLNSRAALITRGLAEMTRLGVALGARTDTFMGLSGLGDLVLTATGDLSRNRKIGLLLAQGMSLEQSVDSLGHVAEGVYSARTVLQRARAAKVEMPITELVVALLDGKLKAPDAVAALMGRDPAAERGYA